MRGGGDVPFLSVSKGEPCGDRERWFFLGMGGGGEGIKQLVPRARRDGGKSWHPLSPWV